MITTAHENRTATDCSVCALANLAGIEYEQADREMREQGWTGEGATGEMLYNALAKYGEVSLSDLTHLGMTAREFARDSADLGDFAVIMPGHVLATRGGRLLNGAGWGESEIRFTIRFESR